MDQLSATFHGPSDSIDAARALHQLSELIRLMGELEVATDRAAVSAPTHGWSFTTLGLGSVVATLAPSRSIDADRLERMTGVPLRLVTGLETIGETADIPWDWSPDAVRAGGELMKTVGDSVETGLTLRVIDGGRTVRATTVTRALKVNLDQAIAPAAASIGSVTGLLGTIMVHDQARASVWPDRQRRRISVPLTDDQVEEAKALLGRRVELRGMVQRNSRGGLITVRVRSMRAAPVTNNVDLASLWGAAPHLTGGLTTAEFLSETRGTA